MTATLTIKLSGILFQITKIELTFSLTEPFLLLDFSLPFATLMCVLRNASPYQT